jgi:Arc/MetJ family transcription regulator
MTRTNIVLDDKIVAKARRATGIKTTRKLVDHALRELVRRRGQRKILALLGKINWEGDLDEMRKDRHST